MGPVPPRQDAVPLQCFALSSRAFPTYSVIAEKKSQKRKENREEGFSDDSWHSSNLGGDQA
jgi:hypothetical protein